MFWDVVCVVLYFLVIASLVFFLGYISERIRARAWRKEFERIGRNRGLY